MSRLPERSRVLVSPVINGDTYEYAVVIEIPDGERLSVHGLKPGRRDLTQRARAVSKPRGMSDQRMDVAPQRVRCKVAAYFVLRWQADATERGGIDWRGVRVDAHFGGAGPIRQNAIRAGDESWVSIGRGAVPGAAVTADDASMMVKFGGCQGLRAIVG
jgi:hypothetical protein